MAPTTSSPPLQLILPPLIVARQSTRLDYSSWSRKSPGVREPMLFFILLLEHRFPHSPRRWPGAGKSFLYGELADLPETKTVFGVTIGCPANPSAPWNELRAIHDKPFSCGSEALA